MKLEIKNDSNNSTVASENIDIGIARACGQNICMISKRILSNAKVKIYQQRLMEFIELIEVMCGFFKQLQKRDIIVKENKIKIITYFILQSLSHDDINTWLALTLEVKKLEAEQVYLQNEVQGLKNNIQDNFLLNHDIAQLTTDIETVDAQMVHFGI